MYLKALWGLKLDTPPPRKCTIHAGFSLIQSRSIFVGMETPTYSIGTLWHNNFFIIGQVCTTDCMSRLNKFTIITVKFPTDCMFLFFCQLLRHQNPSYISIPPLLHISQNFSSAKLKTGNIIISPVSYLKLPNLKLLKCKSHIRLYAHFTVNCTYAVSLANRTFYLC